MARDINGGFGIRKIAPSSTNNTEVFSWIMACGGSATVVVSNADGGDSPLTITLSEGQGIPGTFTSVANDAGSAGDIAAFLYGP